MTPDDLKAWRKDQGLTQEALAAELDLKRLAIYEMENGKRPIDRRTRLALAAIAKGIKPI